MTLRKAMMAVTLGALALGVPLPIEAQTTSSIAAMISQQFQPLETQFGGRHKGLLSRFYGANPANSDLVISTWQHQWPGIYAEARFRGPSLMVAFDDQVNQYRLWIDGKEMPLISKPGHQVLRYDNLGAGHHRVRLEKISESQDAVGTFMGFFVPDGSNPRPAPPPRRRQIEFIGDSYTVGYGNTSSKTECTPEEVWATTDTSKAFGPLIARALNADYQINAFSGRGMVRNYNGVVPGFPLPRLYPFALYDNQTSADDTRWQPQIIFIGLGTNDFSTPLNPGEKWTDRAALHADYVASYVSFIKQLRVKNPRAWITLLATDQMQGEFLAQVRKVESLLRADGERRLNVFPLTGLSYSGCHGHPSVADSAKLALELLADIKINNRLTQR